MPHLYNIAAFRAWPDASPLLQLYVRLVALELRLKDARATWTGGHDVPGLLRELPSPAELTPLAVELERQLAALSCTSSRGAAVSVSPARFPDLRYLRHESDDPAGSSDDDLRGVLEVLDDIDGAIDGAGGLPC